MANIVGDSVNVMIKVVPTFLAAELARNDISGLSRTLYDLQRQTATGFKATDLKGFGDNNRQILSARAEIQRLEGRLNNADRAETRLGVQGFALEKATEGVKALRQSTLEAITKDDGRFTPVELETAFRLVQSALNQTFGGQYLFSGERTDEPTIRVGSLDELVRLPGDVDVFTSSQREMVMDIGDGTSTPVAEQAAEFARQTLVVMRDMQAAFSANGGSFDSPLTSSQRARLGAWVEQIDKGLSEFIGAQARNGALQSRIEAERTRISERIDFMEAQLGEAADADVAEIAMRIAAVQTQYQAAGRVFAQLSELSLINFLR